MTRLYEKLFTILGEGHVKTQEEMKKHTTMRVGGPAACYVSPVGEKELAAVLCACQEEKTPYWILGNGSNLLVSDRGYDGVVISMTEGFSNCSADGESGAVTAGAGASLARIARAALGASLTGLEFAAGIPGTLGGAVVMNAGAYGSEMKDVIQTVRVLTASGETRELSVEEWKPGYRTSCILENHDIVTGATIKLERGEEAAIRARMEGLAAKRRAKQPLELPSCGSTFKRPAGHYAGQLIEEAGLRGFALGGAKVSEKHCGFVVNWNHATATDVYQLCEEIKKKVFETSGVSLEMEVKTLGEF